MDTEKTPLIPWVWAIVLVPFLFGRKWRNKGDEIAVPLERAKKLKAAKTIDFDKRQAITDEPFPVEDDRKISHAEKLKRQRGQVEQQTTPDPDDDGTGGTITTVEDDDQTFDDLGIVGKSAELLIAAGIETPAALRARLADGLDLVTLDGIGKATAATILAAVQPAE